MKGGTRVACEVEFKLVPGMTGVFKLLFQMMLHLCSELLKSLYTSQRHREPHHYHHQYPKGQEFHPDRYLTNSKEGGIILSISIVYRHRHLYLQYHPLLE